MCEMYLEIPKYDAASDSNPVSCNWGLNKSKKDRCFMGHPTD